MKQRTQRSPEEKAQILERIRTEVQNGTRVTTACQAEGITPWMYANWRQAKGLTRVSRRKYVRRVNGGVIVTDLPNNNTPPTIEPGRLMFVTGSTREIAGLIRSLQ